MSKKYELDCRYCDNNRETFDRVDSVIDSDWTEISAMSVISDGVSVHKAHCPAHSSED